MQHIIETAWENLPNLEITNDLKKAIEESKKKKLCVLLLPVSTSTKLFHDFILPNAKKIIFVRGRIKFLGKKGEKITPTAVLASGDTMSRFWLKYSRPQSYHHHKRRSEYRFFLPPGLLP